MTMLTPCHLNFLQASLDALQHPKRLPYEVAPLLLPHVVQLLACLHRQGVFAAQGLPTKLTDIGRAAVAAAAVQGRGNASAALPALHSLATELSHFGAIAQPCAAATATSGSPVPPPALTSDQEAAASPASVPNRPRDAVHCRVLIAGQQDSGQIAVAAPALHLLRDASFVTISLPSALFAGDGDVVSGAAQLLRNALHRAHHGKLLVVYLPRLEIWAVELPDEAGATVAGHGLDDAHAQLRTAVMTDSEGALLMGLQAQAPRRPAMRDARSNLACPATAGVSRQQVQPAAVHSTDSSAAFGRAVSAAWSVVQQMLSEVPRSQPLLVLATAEARPADLPSQVTDFFLQGWPLLAPEPIASLDDAKHSGATSPGDFAPAALSAGVADGGAFVLDMSDSYAAQPLLEEAVERCSAAFARKLCTMVRETALSGLRSARTNATAAFQDDAIPEEAAPIAAYQRSLSHGAVGRGDIVADKPKDELNTAEQELGHQLQQQVRKFQNKLLQLVL